jgi:hypothetical protein
VIAREDRTFDEMLGDHTAPNYVMGAPELAHFGSLGFADGRNVRLNLRDVNITPNLHEMARRWTVADNFYVTSPLEAPAGQAFSPTQTTAEGIIHQLEETYLKPGKPLPPIVYLRLATQPGSTPSFPYAESAVAAADAELGRLMEFLSHTPWWPSMAVFLTAAAPPTGADHIDGTRAAMICGGPWARHNSAVHTNTGPAGLWKTIFRLLGMPSIGLDDRTASDLSACFAAKPDPAPFTALPPDARLVPAADQ